MKTNIVSILITSVAISCSPNTSSQKDAATPNDITGKYYIPALAQAGDGAYITGQLIYPLDNKPTPQCHASTIVETPNGMVTAFFAGTEEGDPDVGIWVSRLADSAWTWPVEVANG